MSRKRSLLSDDARIRINRAIAKAESKTSAEILPAVAASSGRYDRAEDVVGFWFALLLFSVAWMVFQRVAPDGDSWTGVEAVRVGLLPLLGVLVLGFIIGAVLAGRLPGLRRLFVPRREMDRETAERAKAIFFDKRLHRTVGSTGVLLFVSVFEWSFYKNLCCTQPGIERYFGGIS